MKHKFSILCTVLLISVVLSAKEHHSKGAILLYDTLSKTEGVSNLHFINRPPYKDCMLFTYGQPVEYLKDSIKKEDGTFSVEVRRDASGKLMADSSAGFFQQRIMIGYKGKNVGTVMVTEGYSIDRYINPKRPTYQNELSALFGYNEVLVEHRFFEPSAPLLDSVAKEIDEGSALYEDLKDEDFDLNWDFLTTLNAASDHHRIYELLSPILTKGWVATGASKGGLTSTMYATYYPEDMNLIVPYVAPFCVGTDDHRMAEFLLNEVGTAEQREHHNGLVTETLRRKSVFWEQFVAWCDSAQWKFQLPLDTIYQLAALDMPVGLWMYYPDTVTLPALDCSDEELWDWLLDHLGPDGLSCERMAIPYDIQAAKELGCYGYDVEPWKEYLSFENGDGLWQQTYLPQDWTFELDTTMHNRVKKWVYTTTHPVVFVNGENDPWTSVGFSPLYVEEGWRRDVILYHAHDNMYFCTLPRGNHGSKIAKFPKKEQKQIRRLIKQYMRKK